MLDTISINYNDKKERYKIEYYLLYTFFINNDNIITNCYYLLLLYKEIYNIILKI